MINWISNWAEAIIIAVIIATIIEMILPEGNSKKYIKVVIGVYILFTIISPVISNFTSNTLAVSNILDLEKYMEEVKEKESSQNLLQQENAASIRDIYIGNLKADMQNKLKGKGYIVTEITLDVGKDDNYTLNKITLCIQKMDDKNNIKDDTETGNEKDNLLNTQIHSINEISIDISGNTLGNEEEIEEELKLSNSEKRKIKEYLSSVYEIQEKNIIIN